MDSIKIESDFGRETPTSLGYYQKKMMSVRPIKRTVSRDFLHLVFFFLHKSNPHSPLIDDMKTY
jgi:hypothetical protein